MKKALTVCVGAALLLTACSEDTDKNVEKSAEIQEVESLQLTPYGDEGAWFSNDYANGVDGVFAVPGKICGISGGYVFETSGKNPTVRAWDIQTSNVMWEVDGARCGSESVSDEGVIIEYPHTDTGRQWKVVDVETGEEARDLPIPNEPTSVKFVHAADDNFIVATGDGELYAVDSGGEIDWNIDAGNEPAFQVLSDSHIGITERMTDRVRIIDVDNGVDTHNENVESKHDIIWASDGFVLKINESDPEYAFFDVEGNEVDRTVGESQYPFVPRPSDGVTFPIEDHVNAGTVVGVAADGQPALFEVDRAPHTREGRLNDYRVLDFYEISADGKSLLRDAGDELQLVSDSGKTQWTRSLENIDYRVESSYILLYDNHSTQVLIPAK